MLILHISNLSAVKDLLLRATGEKAPLRFIALSLTETMNHIGALHGARGILLEQMAESAISALYLASTIKHAGALTLALRWKGNLSLIETDATPLGLVRQRVPQQEVRAIGSDAPQATPQKMETRQFDETGKLLKRSIVEMGEGSIARNLSWYLMQSDQVKSAVGIKAKVDPADPSRLLYAAGWFIEAFPDCDEATLAIAEQVALDIPPFESFASSEGFDVQQLLAEVAGPFPYVIHREISPEHFCPCNRERMQKNIGKLGLETVQQLRTEQGDVETVCDFCRTPYLFQAHELDAIIAELNNGVPQ